MFFTQLYFTPIVHIQSASPNWLTSHWHRINPGIAVQWGFPRSNISPFLTKGSLHLILWKPTGRLGAPRLQVIGSVPLAKCSRTSFLRTWAKRECIDKCVFLHLNKWVIYLHIETRFQWSSLLHPFMAVLCNTLNPRGTHTHTKQMLPRCPKWPSTSNDNTESWTCIHLFAKVLRSTKTSLPGDGFG